LKAAFSPFCTSLHVWQGTASVFFSSHITPLHSHNTLQLVFDIHHNFLFRTAETDWESFRTLVIKEKIVHQLNTNDSVQLIVYLDPSTILAKKIAEKYLIDKEFCDPNIEFSTLEEALFQQGLVNANPESIELLISLILNKLADLPDTFTADERISRTLQLIKQADCSLLSIEYLADKVFISPSRLRSQFKKQTGMSLHKYIIRQRLLTAITAIVNESTVQEAAFRAGFNDSSHFNKLMMKIFGINPSGFIRENQLGFSIKGDDSLVLATRGVAAG
jgi:AraC-like DNA-binding protein